MDAIALPFVQGHLRQEYIAGLIETECAHCQQPLHIELDSEMQFAVRETEARPLFFAPMNSVEPGAKSIIDGF
ncbi:MAG: hypothetical protein U0694_07590 [Anaerolineae bacterium]